MAERIKNNFMSKETETWKSSNICQKLMVAGKYVLSWMSPKLRKTHKNEKNNSKNCVSDFGLDNLPWLIGRTQVRHHSTLQASFPDIIRRASTTGLVPAFRANGLMKNSLKSLTSIAGRAIISGLWLKILDTLFFSPETTIHRKPTIFLQQYPSKWSCGFSAIRFVYALVIFSSRFTKCFSLWIWLQNGILVLLK